MPDFDADVKAYQGAPELTWREPQFAEESGESQTVDQAESKDDRGSPFRHVLEHEIFDCNESDRERDQRFND